MSMLSIIDDNLKKELTAIRASDHGKAAKKYLPVLEKLTSSSHCEKAWRIAAENKYNSLDGKIYLARAILSALIMGASGDYSVRSQHTKNVGKEIAWLNKDDPLAIEYFRKLKVETPWASRKSGKDWRRICFVHLTGLALYKLDNEEHPTEVMRLTNESGQFVKIRDSNVSKLLKNIDQIAESKSAVAKVSIAYTPGSKE